MQFPKNVQGGYRLMRQPGEYTVGSILRLTEGSLAPVECLDSEINDCPRSETCVTLRLWKELPEYCPDSDPTVCGAAKNPVSGG